MFFRGVSVDEKYQNPARRGNDVRTATRAVVTHPFPELHLYRVGTPMRRARRARLENPSAPGPSAGRTPSFIEGDYRNG